MAICTKCGTVYNNDDMNLGKHICKPENIPKKNEEFIPNTTKEVRE